MKRCTFQFSGDPDICDNEAQLGSEYCKAHGAIYKRLKESKIMTGPLKSGEDILVRLERRMGSMKLVGERDDLLLDAALYIAKTLEVKK